MVTIWLKGTSCGWAVCGRRREKRITAAINTTKYIILVRFQLDFIFRPSPFYNFITTRHFLSELTEYFASYINCITFFKKAIKVHNLVSPEIDESTGIRHVISRYDRTPERPPK